MAKKKKKRKKYRNLKIFFVTLLFTVTAGCIIMLSGHAVSGMDSDAVAASARGLLRRVIAGESGGKESAGLEESGKMQNANPGNQAGIAQETTDTQAEGSGQKSDTSEQYSDTSGQQTALGVQMGQNSNLEARSEAAGGQTADGNDPVEAAYGDGSGAGEYGTDQIQQMYESGAFTVDDKVYAKETARPDEVSLVFAGDILFDDNYAVMVRMKQRGGAIGSSISADMLEVMRSADIFMVNNEFPYSSRGEPTPDKKFTFRGRPEYASYLLDMGADIVSLANNHASDYGTISLTDTIDVLNSIHMPFVGAGRNLEEATKTAYFVANGMKIAILSATQIERMENPATKGATENSPGVFRCLNIDRLLQEIREAKQVSDFVIVYIHWGTESTDQIDWAQREQAPKIAEAGADLIIGDHPHVLQPIGYCQNVPVIYSLGNYLFNSKAQDTCLVRAVLDGNGLKSLQFIPGRQQDCSVTMHYGAEKERVLAYMRSISPGVNIDADGYITKQ